MPIAARTLQQLNAMIEALQQQPQSATSEIDDWVAQHYVPLAGQESCVSTDAEIVPLTVDAVTHWRAAGCALLDLREESAFEEGHVTGSTSFPWSSYFHRTHELPARGTPLALIGESVEELKGAMLQLGGIRVTPIQFAFLWEPSRLAELQGEEGLIQRGMAGCVPLWRPSPCLEAAAPLIEGIVARAWGQREEDVACFGTMIDVGCAQGRELMFMAMRRWNVIGVDKDIVHLRTCEKFFLQHPQPASRVQLGQLDVEREPQRLPGADMVHVGRYLHRPLLPLLRDSVVRPGGFVVYHTFTEGCRAFGRPKRERFLLRDGELREVFAGWHVWMDEVRPVSDGRPLSFFVAQHPGERPRGSCAWDENFATESHLLPNQAEMDQHLIESKLQTMQRLLQAPPP